MREPPCPVPTLSTATPKHSEDQDCAKDHTDNDPCFFALTPIVPAIVLGIDDIHQLTGILNACRARKWIDGDDPGGIGGSCTTLEVDIQLCEYDGRGLRFGDWSRSVFSRGNCDGEIWRWRRCVNGHSLAEGGKDSAGEVRSHSDCHVAADEGG